jgi:hypothetical protein
MLQQFLEVVFGQQVKGCLRVGKHWNISKDKADFWAAKEGCYSGVTTALDKP